MPIPVLMADQDSIRWYLENEPGLRQWVRRLTKRFENWWLRVMGGY